MSRFGLSGISEWARTLLTAHGMPATSAATVVESLAYAERRGIHTHGFIRLRVYLERLQAGGIIADAEPVIERRQGAVAIVDCANCAGAVGAMFATEVAADTARCNGISLVAGRNANHFGAAGFYAQTLADRGLLSIVVCNTDAVMAPAAGGRPVLGTNPIAIGAPSVGKLTPLLDMATSNIAYGKLIIAANSSLPIPLGWAIDRDGKPTTDPRAGLDGALLPLGGPKGFGLAFMIDVLCALGDANVSPDVHPLYGERSIPQKLGFSIIAINPELLAGSTLLTSKLTRLIEAVHGATRNTEAVTMIPGEPEQCFERNSRVMWLTDETHAQLRALADTYELPLPTEAVDESS